jgi:hypothetical protein
MLTKFGLPKFLSATYLVSATLAVPASAQEQELKIWPDDGIYGLEQTNCNRPTDRSPRTDTAKIHLELCDLFADASELQAKYGQYFVQLMKNKFPGVVDKPGDGLPDGVPVSRQLSNSLIASLHISRADVWEINNRTGASAVFLPFSVTLNLTNASSGEVMFTQSMSIIPESVFATRDIFTPARQALPDEIRAGIAQLVQSSAARFKPYPLKATVKSKIGDAYVIDKGRMAGLRRDNKIADDAKVIFADASYAIIKPLIEDLKVGQVVQRQLTAPAEYLAKPSVVTIPGNMPENMSSVYLTQVFEEVLGTQGVLSIMPVNESFPKLRGKAIFRAGISSTAEAKRELPDYLLRLDVHTTPQSEVQTNVEGVTIATFEAYATASIVDRSGRVVFSASSPSRKSDQIVSGIGFSSSQMQDTAAKNALSLLAQRISREFKPQNIRLPIQDASSGGLVDDLAGSLSRNTAGLVIRKVGKISDIKDDVWVPVSDDQYVVSNIQGTMASIKSQDPLARKIQRGDLFVFDGGSLLTQSRKSFSLCAGPPLLDNQSLDLSNEDVIKSIGLSVFAQSYPAPIYLPELSAQAEPRMKWFPGWSNLGAAQQFTPDYCFRPVLRSTLIGASKPSGGRTSYKYNIVMGYAIFRGAEKLTGSGLSAELTSSFFQPTTGNDQIVATSIRDSIAQFFTASSGALKNIQLQK